MRAIFFGIFVFTVSFALFASASQVTAITTQEIAAQLQTLFAQIQQLQKQLNELIETQPPIIVNPQPQSSNEWCNILRDLRFGSRGEDVRWLQTFLQKEGYLSAKATGYFGQLTRNAVQEWQEKERIFDGNESYAGWGILGPRSIAFIKKRCGEFPSPKDLFRAYPQNGEAPLSVTFETNISGFHPSTDKYTIEYGDGTSEPAPNCYAPTDFCTQPGVNTHTYSTKGTYEARIIHTRACRENFEDCSFPIPFEVLGSLRISVGEQRICPAVMYQRPLCRTGEIAKPIYDNSGCPPSLWHCVPNSSPENDPQCKSWSDDCTRCERDYPGGPSSCTSFSCREGRNPEGPHCEKYFGDAKNKPPVISSFSGPTTLNINEQGTWKINASDPENGQLSYDIRWGDEKVYPQALRMSLDNFSAFTQTTTFTHAYVNDETYTISITVRDNAGQVAQTTSTVRVVGGETVHCTQEYAPVCGIFSPISPNSGDSVINSSICVDGAGFGFCSGATKTFSNLCELKNSKPSGFVFFHYGQCKGEHINNVGCIAPGEYKDKQMGKFYLDRAYFEGDSTSTIRNPDGTISTIWDAYYVCRSGEWKIEGGLRQVPQ